MVERGALSWIDMKLAPMLEPKDAVIQRESGTGGSDGHSATVGQRTASTPRSSVQRPHAMSGTLSVAVLDLVQGAARFRSAILGCRQALAGYPHAL